MKTVRRAVCVAASVVALTSGCTSTNISEPGRGSGGRVYFASNREDNNFEIYSISGDGKALRRLTNDNEHNDRTPVVSPDGRFVAWVREVAGTGGGVTTTEIWVMNSDGLAAHPVVQNASDNQSPSWLPDGTGLVYASFVTGNFEIFRVTLPGGTPVNLSNSPLADQNPRVSPDGSRIVFHTNRDLDFEVYAMGIDGGNVTNLSNDPGDDRFPNWLPDGTGIVWNRFSETFDLFLMDDDGGNKRPLLASGFDERDASISPDGQSVVFVTNRIGGSTSLFTAPLAGGEPVPLTGNSGATSASEIEPWWSK